MEQYKIAKFIDGEFSLDVKTDEEKRTVWLSQAEIAQLFNKDISVISRHINNILNNNEVVKKSNLQKMQIPNSDKKVNFYGLDIILSIGYRVNSDRGIQFRKWANTILNEYLIKGYAINERRMNALNKTIEIQNKMLSSTLQIDNDELVNVVNEYTKALDLLDDYDHQCLKEVKGNKEIYVLTYEECRKIIDSMKFGNNSDLFGKEKEEGKLNGILAAVYQNVFGEEVYKTLEDKASHLLYFLIKDHPFMDGCKRIAATLFLEFLNKNKALVRDGKLRISNDALVAITLLIAESNPKEIDSLILVVRNLLV